MEYKRRVNFLCAICLLHRRKLHFLLALAGAVLSLGFAIGTGNNANYTLIFNFAPPLFWSFLFGVYTCIKVVGCFRRIDSRLKTTNSVVGLWAWNYIFLSFTVFDSTPIAPTELLLAVPTLIELWSMLDIPSNFGRRRGDNK